MTTAARAWLAAALAATALACGGPPQDRRGGPGTVGERGILRAAVPPWLASGPAAAPDATGERELLARLADRLGVRLRLVPVTGDPAEAVRRGVADLGVSRFAPRRLAERGLAATAPLEWVDDLLVESPRARLPGHHARPGLWLYRGDPYWPRALDGSPGRPRYPVPDDLPPERLLRRVVRGRYGATIVDSGRLAALGLAGHVRIVATVARERPVVWVVPAGAVALRRAVDDFLFSERVLRGYHGPPACRDLDGIVAARTLRLLTRDGPLTCTVERGGITGFQYELVRRFALGLGVRLELVLLPPGADPLAALADGWGDLLALHEPLPLEAEGTVRLGPALRLVAGVAVVRRGAAPPTGPDGLAGLRVAAAPGWLSRLAELPVEPPPVPVAAEDGLSALATVARGRADVAVVGDDLALLVLPDRPELIAGGVVVGPQPIAWVLRPDQPRLAARVERFLAGARRDGTLRTLTASLVRRAGRRRARTAPALALSPWDAQFKRAALEVGIDWRLLAAVAYEESRWDPRAVGPGGSAGLFQLMPATAQWLGVRDPFDPEEAVPAAARYLRQLMDEFADVPLADRVAMAVAAFNVGPRHVHDARRLAARMGLDPNRWRNAVETAMVLLDDPEVARRLPAGVCRCRRAVHYTRRILRRYFLYAELFPPGNPSPLAAVPGNEAGPTPG